MNNSTTFVRKIIYLGCVGALLVPLSLVSRPAARETGTKDSEKGGKLAQLRDEYNLSQAKLMEIDPASETMKLASLGLRGVAVNMLWMQAMEHRKEQNWDQLRSTLNALIKIQPNFIKVWEYQAHNLSYNISVEFDDYEYRYHWVKEGIKFLTEGIPYNYRNHRITDNLGFFTGMKIGRSDEKLQFRRLFRKDTDFHEDMFLAGQGVEPELYFAREYGPDNWKMAYQWYDKSRSTVQKFGQQYLSDMMFYRKRPMQLMNQARSLQQENATDDIIQEIWRDANREWFEFGQQEIRTSRGIPITFEGLADMDSRLAGLRRELDDLLPGYRDAYMAEIREQANLTEEQRMSLEIPADERTEEQSILAAGAEVVLQKRSRGVDTRIAENATPGQAAEVRRLLEKISRVLAQMQFVDSYAETVNYRYWLSRSKTESLDVTADARRALFNAQEMKRNSIFDDEYQFNPKTGEKTIVKQGAISMFEDAFQKWKVILDDPEFASQELADGELVDDLMDAAEEYYDMLRITGRDWPENFVFQEYIDYRAQFGDTDLPTSADVAERISGQDEGNLDDENVDSDDIENESADAESAGGPVDNDSPENGTLPDGSGNDNGMEDQSTESVSDSDAIESTDVEVNEGGDDKNAATEVPRSETEEEGGLR